MLRYGFFLFAYVIFLAHVHTFVLLTANFGDLKRIAQKFVQEAVSDNIADFISKASESLTGANISEENPENYNFKNKSSKDKETESEDSKDLEDAQSISDEVTTESSIVSIDSIQTISTESFHNKKSKLESFKKRKRKINEDKVDVNLEKVESITVYRQKTNDNVYLKPEKDDSKKVYQGHKTNDDVYVNSEKVGSKNLQQQKKTNVKVNINPATDKSKKVYQRKKNDKFSVKSERVESQKGYQHKKTTSPQNILEIKIEYDESEQSDERNNVGSKSFTAGLDVFSDENKSLEKSNVVDSLNGYSDVQNNNVVKATPNSKYSEFESNEDIESNSKHSNKDSLNTDVSKLKSEYSKRVESNESKDESKSKRLESNESEDESKSKRLESNESKDKSKSINSNESRQDNMYKADISDTLTTRVERNEFDQYVNLNYPKSELVATSGPLALTMVVDTRIN